jgi:hypothetical protein
MPTSAKHAKIFLTFKFSYLLFCNPAHNKTERSGTVCRWELLIANHLDQSKIGNCSQITFIALFSGRFTAFAAPFTSLSELNRAQFARAKPIFLS